MEPKILVSAETTLRNHAIADILAELDRSIDLVTERAVPEHFSTEYQIFVWEGAPKRQSLRPFLRKLPQTCEVVLLLPELDVRWISYYMDLQQLNHFILGHEDCNNVLREVTRRINGGIIFGLERFLPPSTPIQQQYITTFQERCGSLDEMEAYIRDQHLGGEVRRVVGLMAEELLMNAMYQAPVDAMGRKLFSEIGPKERIFRETPRPVSIRYAAMDGRFYLSVRDQYGSLDRHVIAECLFRCATRENPIEEKKLGAGLGLYQVATMSKKCIVNIQPGSLTEVICVCSPSSRDPGLKLFSLSTSKGEDMSFSL